MFRDRGTRPQWITPSDADRALDQHVHAWREISRHEQRFARGVAPNFPKTAKPIIFVPRKLRKHLLVAGIDRRRHFKPLGQGADPVGTLMSHQQRDRRLVHEIVGHPAEQPLTQAKMPVSARDDEVSLLSLPAISRAPTSLRRLLTR